MQDMKVRSGAVQVRVDKNPRDFCGIMMRVVTIEGTPLAVKKAHFCFQELFLPDAAHQLVLAESGGASMPPPSALYGGGHPDGTDASEGADGGYAAHDDGAYLGAQLLPSGNGAVGDYGLAEIPLDELKAFGVLPAVVDTLHDIKQLFKDQVFHRCFAFILLLVRVVSRFPLPPLPAARLELGGDAAARQRCRGPVLLVLVLLLVVVLLRLCRLLHPRVPPRCVGHGGRHRGARRPPRVQHPAAQRRDRHRQGRADAQGH
jgi:hypothetical protein